MKIIVFISALLAFCFAANAQPQPGQVWVTTSNVPSGSCTATFGYLVVPAGTLYTCQNGTWAQASGGGGNCPTGAVNVVQASNGSGGCQATSAVDNGTTFTTTEPVHAPSFTSSDSSHSGILNLSGKTSGEVSIVVDDVAGTAIAYVMPSTNGSTGQVLTDNGVVTCPTLPAGSPSVCHQMIWSTPSGGSGGVGYNPADHTQYYTRFTPISYTGSMGWTYTGGCSAGGGTGSTAIFQQTIIGGVFSNPSGAGTLCIWYFPVAGNYQNGFFDYFSGSAPSWLYVSSSVNYIDANGAQYVGVFVGNTPSPNSGGFYGCRAVGSGHWFAVIRAAGTDVATADTGVAFSTGPHRVQVDNGTGTSLATLATSPATPVANSIRCTVDGSTTATVSGTVPASAGANGGISFGSGVSVTGATPSVFMIADTTLWFQKLSIN